HSSAERVIVPDATTTADFMLVRLEGLLKNLMVYPENMMKNFNLLRGLTFSQQVMLALVEKGMIREEAYKIVQELAMKVWKDQNLNFKDLVFSDQRIRKFLTQEEIEHIFDVKYYLRYVDQIFERVFG
ncbi:MAG TPA: adenylosuccinate lyase, partial [Thermodesulfobacterium commune]|nr:adenylosuccinate lyase [Thermodesulfobacterium commune]